jgi:hypothetical protein
LPSAFHFKLLFINVLKLKRQMEIQDSTLFRYLRCLSGQDRNALDKLVRSPFFNQREDVIQLWIYLRPALEGAVAQGSLAREATHAAVWPGAPYDARRLSYTMSFLLKTVQQYLSLTEAMHDQAAWQASLCQALLRRGGHALAEKAFDEALTRHPPASLSDCHQAFLLHRERTGLRLRQGRHQEADFQESLNRLSVYFLASAMQQGCAMLSHQAVAGQAYRLGMAQAAARLVEEGCHADEPLVILYYHCYRMLSETDADAHFLALKQTFERLQDRLADDELRNASLFAVNYCIGRLNRGDKTYVQEAFQLYMLGLKQGYLLENGYLSDYAYKNIARLGIALGEVGWVRQFLDDYRPKLHPAKRENAYGYNLAFYFFQQGDYAQAMPLLQQLTFRDTLNKLDARRLLLRSYYELGEYNALESLLDSFSLFLHRQEGLGYHRENYTNLIAIVRKMIRYEGADKKMWRRLHQEAQAMNALAEKEWLLQLIERRV